jgi:hypothetical protein
MAHPLLELPLSYKIDIEEHGFSIVENVTAEKEVEALRSAIELAINESRDSTSVRDRGGVYAIRNVTEVVPEVRALHRHSGIAQLVEPILGSKAMLVRGLMFDKSPESNWGIFWHQDLSIAVRQREDVPVVGQSRYSTRPTATEYPKENADGQVAPRRLHRVKRCLARPARFTPKFTTQHVRV